MPNETFKRRSADSSPRIAWTTSIVMTAGLWVELAAGCWREVEFGTCGDNNVDPDEDCDNGRDNLDPASALPGDCTRECTVQPGCGDRKIDKDIGEECEPEIVGSDQCTDDCQRPTICGDKYANRDIGEECDDGVANKELKDAMPDDCTTECKKARCGNKSVEYGETCDDVNGNKRPEDAKIDECTDQCKRAACGDAQTNMDEECDWGGGNKAAADAEHGDCTTECKNPKCGDGTKNADEECDDGNADLNDDSCKTCLTDKFAFITKGTWRGGALGGLTGADDKCQKEANDAMLEGRYMAWLSDSDESPSSRFKSELFTGRYLLPSNRSKVAVGWSDLIDGTISTPILVHADGSDEEMKEVRVWTNTNSSGEIQDPMANCNNWRPKANGKEEAIVGHAHPDALKNGDWTVVEERQACKTPSPLYCFGVSPIEVQP